MFIVLTGRPGAGKTRSVANVVKKVKSKPILCLFPLRALRDAFYEQVKDNPKAIVVRSREELCLAKDKLKEAVTKLSSYFRLPEEVAYRSLGTLVCARCPYKEKCEYYKQYELLKDGYYNIIIATHKMSPALFALKKWYMIYFDEFETYFHYLNGVKIPEGALNRLLEHPLGHLFHEIIVNNYVKVDGFYVPPIKPPNSKYIVISSATPIIPLIKLISKEHKVIFKELPVKQEKDYLIFVYSRRKLREGLLKVLKEGALDKFLRQNFVGFISPNKEYSKKLVEILTKKGYNVCSDVKDEHPPPMHESEKYNYVVTTKGKWFRGVNLADKPIIIGIYQWQTYGGKLKIHNPLIQEILSKEEIDALREQFVPAENVQALFRLNRIPYRQHAMIVERKFADALRMFLPKYYEKCEKHSISDISELKKIGG